MSHTPKLRLNRETLRHLSDAELAQAQGGFIALSLLEPEICVGASIAGRCPSMAGPCSSLTIAL